MALNTTVTGTTPSASTNPTQSTSEFIVEGDYTGTVFVEVQKPSGEWRQITSGRGTFSGVLLTPDPALLYRFRPSNVSGNAEVWFGP